MTALKIRSVAGDAVVIESSPQGFHLGVVPAEPPESDAVDVFALGLSFSSVVRVLSCLRGGPPVELNDGEFLFSMSTGTPTMRFELHHKRGCYFSIELGSDEELILTSYLADLLEGGMAYSDMGSRVRAPEVGRNDPCPCGSGRKYKKCCLGRGVSQSVPTDFAFALQSTDSLVREMLELATAHPELARDADFWEHLGGALGSAGDHEAALHAFRRTLELAPGNVGVEVNIAVTEGALGWLEQALARLGNLPDAAPRKSIVAANLLQELDRHEEAIPLYEAAIQEEPDFFLPYARILGSLAATRSPLLDYWLDCAISAVPNSPAVANFYCYHLLREGRISELADAEWIDRLESEHGRPDIVGRSQSDPKLIVEAQLFRLVGTISANHSHGDLEKAVTTLLGADPSWHLCDPAKLLAATAANLGSVDFVRATYRRICPSCQKDLCGLAGPESTYLARAAKMSGSWDVAIKYAEISLTWNEEDRSALWDYWWCLDEVNRIEDAIEAAQRLYGLGTEPGEGMAYNLGYLCGKAGFLGRAHHYYQAALDEDSQNWRALENLAFLVLLQGEIDQAEELWQRYLVAYRHPPGNLGDEVVTDELHLAGSSEIFGREELERTNLVVAKQAKWDRLREEAEKTRGSRSYALDLIQLNQTSEPLIGAHTTVGSASFSIRKLVAALQGANPDGAIDLTYQLSMRERGDYSAVLATLKPAVPVWDDLPTEAQVALLEGERRILGEPGVDHAPEVLCFAKAVEIALRRLVFDPYAEFCRASIDLEVEVETGLQNRFKRAHTFVRFVGCDQHIELGAMTLALRMCDGKTARRLPLLGRFKKFVSEHLRLSALLSDASFADLESLSQLRNPAVHSSAFGAKEAQEARAASLRELGRFRSA